MTTTSDKTPLLARHDGESLYSAPEAMLKGLLEAEPAVSLVVGPAIEPFAALLRLGAREPAAALLRDHELRLARTPDAVRAVTLALHAARSISDSNRVTSLCSDCLSSSAPRARSALGCSCNTLSVGKVTLS